MYLSDLGLVDQYRLVQPLKIRRIMNLTNGRLPIERLFPRPGKIKDFTKLTQKC
jgi:hypothetical protein